MNKQKVYIETSFLSYLTSKPNRDLIIAAHQQITQEWWENRVKHFDIYISQLVYEEAIKGDAEAAQRRIEILSKLLANATIRTELERVCHEKGYINPIICTPEELMGE